MKLFSNISQYESIDALADSVDIVDDIQSIRYAFKLSPKQLQAIDAILEKVIAIRDKDLDKMSTEFGDFYALLENYIDNFNTAQQPSTMQYKFLDLYLKHESNVGIFIYFTLCALGFAAVIAAVTIGSVLTGGFFALPCAFLAAIPLVALAPMAPLVGINFLFTRNTHTFADIVEQRFISRMRRFKTFVENPESKKDPLNFFHSRIFRGHVQDSPDPALGEEPGDTPTAANGGYVLLTSH